MLGTSKEWELFLLNFALLEDAQGHTVPSWIKKNIQTKVICLKINLETLYDLLHLEDERLWRNYIESNTSIEPPVNLTEFQKILVNQIFRPDVLLKTMKNILTKVLGISVPCESKPTVQQLFDETRSNQPIMYITNGGIDPTKEISDYIESKFPNSKYREFAIGKGEEMHVLKEVHSASQAGDWICIKNVHLVPNWIKSLHELLHELEPKDSFRVWLISESIQNVAPEMLSKCNYLLYEPPNGIQQRVERLIRNWRGLLEKKGDIKTLRILVVLLLFDSIIQERRLYIPQGWSFLYNFCDADLKTALDVIQWMESSITYKIDWKILRELLGSIAYGGRIKTDQDVKILQTILLGYFSEKTLTTNWSPLQKQLTLPISNNIQDYSDAFHQLPKTTGPEVLGLSSTTTLTKDTEMCKNILKRLRRKFYQSCLLI